MRKKPPLKLYCYTDETGQDTEGKLYAVTSIIVDGRRDEMLNFLEAVEEHSNKGSRKWNHSKETFDFLQKALTKNRFKNSIFFKVFNNTKEYENLTALAIIAGIKAYLSINNIGKYKMTIIIDALKGKQQLVLGPKLRDEGIRTEKIKGARDDTNALVRLADTVVGLIREGEQGKHIKVYRKLRKKLEQDGILTEL